MTDLKHKLERRMKDTFFGYSVNTRFGQLTPDLSKKCKSNFTTFYERARKYLCDKYDFSANSFYTILSKLGLTSDISFGDFSDALKACNLGDIDMDELYEEYGIVESIINSPEMINCLSDERYRKVFSGSEISFTNLKKVSSYIFSIPCSNAHLERLFQ